MGLKAIIAKALEAHTDTIKTQLDESVKNIVGEYVREEWVTDHGDLMELTQTTAEKLARDIDVDDIAQHIVDSDSIDSDELAENLAERFSSRQVTEEVLEHISIDESDIADVLADRIDTSDIVEACVENLDIQGRVTDAVEAAVSELLAEDPQDKSIALAESMGTTVHS